MSEAFFLLKHHTDKGTDHLTGMLRRGLVQSTFKFTDAESRVLAVLKKYADLPTSFADACLVAMTEQHQNSEIWTLDGAFRIYRKLDRRVIPLIIPNWI